MFGKTCGKSWKFIDRIGENFSELLEWVFTLSNVPDFGGSRKIKGTLATSKSGSISRTRIMWVFSIVRSATLPSLQPPSNLSNPDSHCDKSTSGGLRSLFDSAIFNQLNSDIRQCSKCNLQLENFEHFFT